MNSEELKKIGEWLNTKGYGIDLSDDFWMEEYDWCEHKTRDICQMLFDYHAEQCNIANVVGRSEQLVCECGNPSHCTEGDTDNCWDCGYPMKSN